MGRVTPGSTQIWFKKHKVENVSLAQWTIPNLAILYRLHYHGEGKLTKEGILDYLSYTTKVCQLVQRFNLVSVLLYDKGYRKLQCMGNRCAAPTF